MEKPGDKVEVHTSDETIKGILMPSLETDKNTLIIKLENGYNMGISKENIEKINVIEKYVGKTERPKEHTFNPKLPVVSILSTGGTISSKIDYRTGGVYADYTADDFVAMCPELSKVANIKAKKVLSLMSEDMLPGDWEKIAKVVLEEIKTGVDGIIVTQGTDTLHFTASALSFMLEEINIPVVILGSQRSIDRGSSDAFMNLICAVKAAATFDAAEVMTCMHGNSSDDYCILIRGTKVRKMHTSRRDAFRPINDVPFAKVFIDKDFEIMNDKYKKADRDKRKVAEVNTKFEEKVALITVYPGMDPDIIDYYLDKKIKGFVIAGTGLGHVNTWTKKSLLPSLIKCHKKKIPVFITSQTLYGSVNPFVYTNLRKLSVEAGCIYLNDMMSETAYIKLGWVLGQTDDYDKTIKMMTENFKGEVNESLNEKMFLN